jgi:hypothetical protein
MPTAIEYAWGRPKPDHSWAGEQGCLKKQFSDTQRWIEKKED